MIKESIALKHLNLSVFLHFTGRLLYRTFVPMILLANGYTLNQIFIYLIGYSLATIIISTTSIKFLGKRKVLLFYILAIIAEIILITLLIPEKLSYTILSPIVLMEGVYYSYYYISYNSIIAHYTSREKASNNLGNLKIVGGLANIFAPIIGALLLMINKDLFIVAAILFLVFSIIPLLKIIKTDVNGINLPKIKIKTIAYELFSCGTRSGIEFIVFTIWAIFVFTSGYSLIYIGLIPAIEAVVNILLLHTIKNKLVSIKIRTITKIISIFGIMAISTYRFFFPEQMILTNSTIALFFTAFSLSVNADYFEKIKNHQTYYSSVLLGVAGFGTWIILGSITFFVGLKYSILIPVALSFIWLLLSFKRLSTSLIKSNK